MDRPTRAIRLLAGLAGVALVIPWTDGIASAQSGPNSATPGIHTGGTRTASGAQVAVAGGQSVIPTSGRFAHRGGARRSISCTYSAIDGIGQLGPTLTDLTPETKVWRSCFDTATGARVSGPIIITVGAAAPARPAVTAALIDMALANIDIDLPVLMTSPSNITLPNFDTWLWTAAQPVERASASAAGVTITVTATRASTAFEVNAALAADNGGETVTSRDDGAAFVCSGPGTPFDPRRPVAGQQSDCTHRFSVPTRNLTIDITSRWHIVWRATNGTSGDLGFVQRTATRPLRVQEKQSTIRTR